MTAGVAAGRADDLGGGLGGVLGAELGRRLGAAAVWRGDEVPERFAGRRGRPGLVLRPRTTAEVAAILQACDAAGQPVVVVGGATGFGYGAEAQPGEIALSLERMTTLAPVDAIAGTVVAEAGVVLQRVQEAAEAAGLFFGVDLGARGSATVGGNVATNAGGNRVLRYGMFRAQVVGLEAVLADGTVVSSLSGLVKDNAGYDLKQLFVGSEGTLGVVTRAMLKLHPKPASQTVAVAALPSLAAALDLLALMRARLGARLSAFELLWGDVYAGAVALPAAGRPPLAPGAPLYAIVEQQGDDGEADPARFEAALAAALEAGCADDVVVSRSGRDVAAFWAVRENASAFIFTQADCHGFDVGVPLAAMAAFLARVRAGVAAADPDAHVYLFGHLGDGNLHVLVRTRRPEAVAPAVYGAVRDAGGTVAAEHGIGFEKKPWLGHSRSAAEIAVMRRLKRALDPNGILNPGRIFDGAPAAAAPEGGPRA